MAKLNLTVDDSTVTYNILLLEPERSINITKLLPKRCSYITLKIYMNVFHLVVIQNLLVMLNVVGSHLKLERFPYRIAIYFIRIITFKYISIMNVSLLS